MEVFDNARLQQHYRHARVLALGLVSSIPLYVAAGELVAAGSDGFQGFASNVSLDLLRGIAVMLGLSVLFVANMVRRRLLAGENSLAAQVRQAMVPQERYANLLRGTVLTLVLCDILGVLGLSLFVLGGQRLDLYAFAVAGLIAAWFHFPRYTQWQRWYAQRSRVR